MALVYAPSAPYPPSQAVFVHAKLSTKEFTATHPPIGEKDVHKLTAMPHCTAFYDQRLFADQHNGAMCVSACGTQALTSNVEPLGVICDPVLDGIGVHRHPNQLGSVACGIRGMFTITVSNKDLRGAAIGDNLYISEISDQNGQANVANSMTGYKLLRYTVQESVQPDDDDTKVHNKIRATGLVGRIVAFGQQNEVTVILA
jgi:hypothetical protein